MREFEPKLSEELKAPSAKIRSNCRSMVEYISSMQPIFYKDPVIKNITEKDEGHEMKLPFFSDSIDYGEVRKLPLAFGVANALMTTYIPDIKAEEEKGTIDNFLVSYLAGYSEGMEAYNKEIARKRNKTSVEFFIENLKDASEWTDNKETKVHLDNLVQELEKSKAKRGNSKGDGTKYRKFMKSYAEQVRLLEFGRIIDEEVRYSAELVQKKDNYFTNVAKNRSKRARYKKIRGSLEKGRKRWGRDLTGVIERLKADLYVSMVYRGQVIANTIPSYAFADKTITDARKKYFYFLMHNSIQAIDILCEKYIGTGNEKYLRRGLDKNELMETRNALMDISNIFGRIEPGERPI